MNARTVKKLLMKGRHDIMWGRRAMVTARLPMSVLPEPMPPAVPKEVGEPDAFAGYYKRMEGEHRIFTNISEVSAGRDPRKRKDADAIHYLTEEHGEYDTTDDDGNPVKEKWSDYTWWEIVELVQERTGPDEHDWKTIEKRQGPVEYLDIYRKYKMWCEKYLRGMHGQTGSDVLDAFLAAGDWAKTTYPWTDKDYIYITYSVKWRYPRRKFGFSADIARAVRYAKRKNVPVRILRA